MFWILPHWINPRMGCSVASIGIAMVTAWGDVKAKHYREEVTKAAHALHLCNKGCLLPLECCFLDIFLFGPRVEYLQSTCVVFGDAGEHAAKSPVLKKKKKSKKKHDIKDKHHQKLFSQKLQWFFFGVCKSKLTITHKALLTISMLFFYYLFISLVFFFKGFCSFCVVLFIIFVHSPFIFLLLLNI